MSRTTSIALSSSLLFACAARPVDDEANVTTNVTTMAESESSQLDEAEESESESESESGLESSTTSLDTGESDGDGDGDDDDCWESRKLDLPADSEAPMPESCTVERIPWPTPEQYPNCMICELDSGCIYEAYLGCVTPATGETCADICPSGDCLGAYWNACEGEGPSGWDESPSDTCGHYEIDGKCCTIGKFRLACAE
ncbi:MAG: hypothetical protein R6X02_12705 [Enhygromyxa sp.]